MTHPMAPALVAAVYNNAVWCDTVCRSHGTPGEFMDGIWINRHPAPPFYPNAVTLVAGNGEVTPLPAIHALLAERLPGAWAVKDSFCALDLGALGFRPLFDATWIWRSATPPRLLEALPPLRWVDVRDPAELMAWERAWGGTASEEEAAPGPRLFLPTLLADPAIAVIAAYADDRIVVGGIANRTGEVVGMSNVFVPADNSASFRAGCIAAMMEAFPGLPLVGYEAGDALAEVRMLGFDELAPLRVWVRATASN